jgi:hypothetical protein
MRYGTRLPLAALVVAIGIPMVSDAQSAPPPPSPTAITLTATPTPDATTTPGLYTIVVPRHTIIPVIMTKDIRVGGAGDEKSARTFKAEVAQDVIVNGAYVVKKGDLAEGHVTTDKNVTKRVFSTDVSQEVLLDVDDVVNFCGDTIHTEFERTFVGGVRGGFMSFGAHAHDAVFDKGTVLKAQSDRLERSVCAEKTTATPAPLPSQIVVPDEEVTR